LEIINAGEDSSQSIQFDTTVTQPNLTRHTKASLDLDMLKNCGQQGISSFNMDTLSDPKNYMDDNLVDSILTPFSVSGNPNWHINVSPYEHLSCYQWEENDDFFLFTAVLQDESCCLTMFLILTDTNGAPLQVQYFGVSGADGGWHENDWVKRIAFGKFRLGGLSIDTDDYFQTADFLGQKNERTEFEYELSLVEGLFKTDTIFITTTDTLIPLKTEHSK
jgi:hypothetical protein